MPEYQLKKKYKGEFTYVFAFLYSRWSLLAGSSRLLDDTIALLPLKQCTQVFYQISTTPKISEPGESMHIVYAFHKINP